MAIKTKSGISKDTLRSLVVQTLKTAASARKKAQTNFGRNVVDPFSMLFEIAGFKMTFSEWKFAETQRQAQKTLQNQVGQLHQKLIGGVQGWSDLGKGNIVDVVNEDRRIVAEIKNKYNTVKGSDQVKLYDQLKSLVKDVGQQRRGYTAYYVKIIPKSAARFDRPFVPSDNKNSEKRQADEKIREIDGVSFYELVLNRQDALRLLHEDLIDVADELLRESSGQLSDEDRSQLAAFFKKAFSPALPSS